ncbi:MAG TPA: hypothetical protein VF941_09695 [Clostridia bacterium]
MNNLNSNKKLVKIDGKKGLLLIFILIILVGVSGCLSANCKLSSKGKEVKVLEYLKNKYNEEFVPLSISGSGWGRAMML